MNTRHVAVWIDHNEAKIFHVNADGFETSSVHSPNHHVRRHPIGSEEKKSHPADAKTFASTFALSIACEGRLPDELGSPSRNIDTQDLRAWVQRVRARRDLRPQKGYRRTLRAVTARGPVLASKESHEARDRRPMTAGGSSEGAKARQVERPVVVQEIVRGDGTRALGFRVFCPANDESVAFEVCQTCPQCIEIVGDASTPQRAVLCSPQVVQRSDASILAEDLTPGDAYIAVGAVVAGTVCAVHVDVSLASLRSLFAEKSLSYLFVIDEANKVIGVVRDVDVHRPSLRSLRTNLEVPERCVDPGVAEIMSPTLSVREDAPLRWALVQMASSRARQVPVLTSSGELLASLVDIDGLRRLAHHD